MDVTGILKELLSVPAVSGFEKEFTGLVKGLMEAECDEVRIDSFYNVIGVKKGSGTNRKRIMLTAHYDEIGFIVSHIDDEGFVKISGIGGVDGKILLSQEVVIHGKEDIYGVIGAKPPHLIKPEEIKKAVKIEDLSIDTGMGAGKLKEFISLGDVVTFKSLLTMLQDSKISSKSFDNRCGIAALIGTLYEISQERHEADIYFAATTQEEVGLRGAAVAAYNIEPAAAVVIDACHGDMPDSPKEETYTLGKGPAIAVGPNLHRNLTNRIIETAKQNEIPYQIDIEPGDTGTEAWAVQVTRSGIPTVLVSIPLRYMHTTVETVHIPDIENTSRLCSNFIKGLTTEELEAILCF